RKYLPFANPAEVTAVEICTDVLEAHIRLAFDDGLTRVMARPFSMRAMTVFSLYPAHCGQDVHSQFSEPRRPPAVQVHSPSGQHEIRHQHCLGKGRVGLSSSV